MKISSRVLLLLIASVFCSEGFGQNLGVNATGAQPDSSAMLDVSATDKGILIPRTDTTTLNASGVTLATGLMIYQTIDNKFYWYNGTKWIGIDGPDDQQLSFSGTTLSISNGNSVNLSSLQDGTGTDDQTIDAFSLSGTTLNLSLEDDGQAPQTVNLSSLQDGTGTDDQTIDAFSLTGTTLNLSLEDDGQAPQTVNLSSLQDGTGTDDQTIDAFSLSGTTLSLSLEDDGQAPQTVNLSSLQDGTGTDDQTIDSFSIVGTTLNLSIENDGLPVQTLNLNTLQDNLGDHIADQNLQLNSNWLSNDGGNEGIRITNSGSVGIGDSSPGTVLNVVGPVRASHTDAESNYIEVDHGGSNAYINWAGNGDLDFRAASNTIASFTSTGQLAIGNFTPSSALDVSGDIEFSGVLKPDNTAGTSGQVLISQGSTTTPTWVDATSLTVTGDNLGNHIATSNIQLNDLYLSNDGGSEGIRVNDIGHVGIGSNALTNTTLYIKDTDAALMNMTSSSTGTAAFAEWNNANGVRGIIGANGSGFAGSGVAGVFSIATWSNHPISFYTNTTERMRLTTTGLGVGETSPQTTLDVKDFAVIGDVSVGSQSTDQSSGNNNNLGFLTAPWLYTNAIEARGERGASSTLITVGNDGTYGTDDEIHLVTQGNSRLMVGNSGNVAIGTTSPSSSDKLEVSGDVNATDFNYSSAQTRYYQIPLPDWRSADPDNYQLTRQGFNLETHINGSVSSFPGMWAPVHLPHGATVTNISVYVYDNSSHNMQVFFYRDDWNGGTSGVICNVFQSSGTPGNTTLSQSSFSSPVIDLQNYQYYVYIQHSTQSNGSNLKMLGCRITYTVPSPD